MPNENDVQQCMTCNTPLVGVRGVIDGLKEKNATLQAQVDGYRAEAAAVAKVKADAVAAAVHEASTVAPPGHVTDVDVVGEAGSVVEVKHDAPPVRIIGPTFDLP